MNFRLGKIQTICGKNLLSVSALALLIFSSSAPSFASSVPNPNAPRTYYVSKNGDNTDGRTWATAWNEMDQIRWAEVNPQRHDSIVIDGGNKRMLYTKSLNVQMTAYYYPINISVSSEAGHNGQAVIAPGNTANGIEVSSGGVYINGTRPNGIKVRGARNGLRVGTSAPYPFGIKNIELTNCTEAGLFVTASSYPLSMSQLIIHDNATNVVVQQSGGAPGGPVLNKCWIYNSTYNLPESDGVLIAGSTSGPPMPSARLTNCVVGPGLRDGVNNTSSAQPSLTNCLLLNATRNNVSSYTVSLQNVTSFMTRLNPSGSSHSCIKLQATPMPYNMVGSNVKQSIVFGGMVEIPTTIPMPYPPATRPFPLTAEQNTQFRTTGNTTILAPTMVNPLFVTQVGLVPNQAPVPLLMLLDFSLRPNSPAQGTGSSVTSIKNLLNSFD